MQPNELNDLFSGDWHLHDIKDENHSIRLYRMMWLIRLAEYKLAEMRRDGIIGGPVHLGVGQEAVAVGVSANLRQTDRVFGAHRSHSHILALGSSLRGLFAEVLGKETGLSKGMGGSMHLWDQPRGFYGSVPIVSGTVPLAVGAGLAAKLSSSTDIAVAYFGDGAIEEGVVHESMNFARIQNIPILFVVENNMFASHMHINMRQATWSTARFATANHIPFKVVNGNDVVAVAQAAEVLINRARSGEGPVFLEAITYRWYGHVDWREDVDVGVNRSKENINSWRKHDPIARMRENLLSKNVWSEQEDKLLLDDISKKVDDAWGEAVLDPYPAEESLILRVYA